MRTAGLFTIIGFLTIGTFAQAPALVGHRDFQSWNDVQLTIPVNKRFDVFTKFTLRFGKNVSQLNDGRIAVGVVWKPTKALSISPFYWYVDARNSVDQFRIENRFSVAVTYRFPIKAFGLSHRSTIERRWKQPFNSLRYRAQVTVDKDIPKKVIPGAKFFIADEVFYDSLLKRFFRNRFSIGITKTISPHLALDIYYMRQNDGITRPGDLNTIWTAWKFKL